jgi:hypothetical protein
VAPIEVAPGCPEQPLQRVSPLEAQAEQQLVDDFEHEGFSLPRRARRDGAWAMGFDGTGERPEVDVSDQCAAHGKRAGHFAGGGFSSWGANWTALLRAQPGGVAVPYDATSYGGISFWAAASPNLAVPFSLPVGVTTMDVAWNGGISARMDDYYRSTVSLDHAWRRYEIRFSDLAQPSSADPQVALRLDQLVGLIFWPVEDFDFWLDDVRFEP